MSEFDDEADLDNFEYPEEDDDDGSDLTIPCPYCEEPVYEEAECCPSCGKYLSREDAPRRLPWWLILGLILSIAVVLRWVVLR